MEREVDGQTRIDAILASVQDGLVLIDADANVERINTIAERQLGLTTDAVVGKSLAALGVSSLDDHVRDALRSGSDESPLELAIKHAGDSCVLS